MDRKQSGEGRSETARSAEGEHANRGSNNEDKTRDGGMPGLPMMTGGLTEEQKGEEERTKGRS